MLATDRCDRYGAQAYTAWWKERTKRLLTLCAHHTVDHELGLIAQEFECSIDDRHLLEPA